MSDNYRYAVETDLNGHTTITRGRVYCLRDTGIDTSDTWRWYWDGDTVPAFTIYWRGYPELHELSGPTDEAERAMETWRKAREYGDDETDALNRLARRLTGNWNSTFVRVSLERDFDLYALAWGGDPDNEWRDEIEALNAGEIYRMEVQRYDTNLPSPGWYDDDDVCEEWYGEDKAEAALAEQFPLDEFPAELLIEDRAV